MTGRSALNAPFPLRALSGLLSLATVLLSVVSFAFVLIVPFGLATDASWPTIGLQGTTSEATVEVEYVHGATARHSGAGTTMLVGDRTDLPRVDIERVQVGVLFDRPILRAYAATAIALGLLIAWVGVVSLRRFIDGMMRWRFFEAANSAWLARVGWSAVAWAAWRVGGPLSMRFALTDNDVGLRGFEPDVPYAEALVWLGAGLLVLAIGQAFIWGVRLQELERATI